MAQALAAVWGLLVWTNWYRWNATGPEADWMAFTASASRATTLPVMVTTLSALRCVAASKKACSGSITTWVTP